ncbi:MAG: FecR domain-containing protein [Gammaproteobacteria bacterium]
MISETRIDEATDWFLRVRSEVGNADDFVPLQQWLRAHPDNPAAYRKVCATWSAIDDVASSPEVMIGRRDALDDAHRVQQRRWSTGRSTRWWQGLAACAVGVALLALLMVWKSWKPGEVYETGIGERRVLTLSDGSLVNLDARTRIEVHYTDETRAIQLESGQASFKVSRNPARPFRVSSNGQTVVALGTEFNVDVVTGEIVVTLIEGRVAVVPDAVAPTSRVIELSAGQQLLSAGGSPPEIRSQVDLSRAVAWQSGKIFFNDEPLSSAVTRINRYASPQLEIDPSVERIRISGTFNAGDTAAFTEAMSTYFPVKVVPAETGALRLTARDGP